MLLNGFLKALLIVLSLLSWI